MVLLDIITTYLPLWLERKAMRSLEGELDWKPSVCLLKNESGLKETVSG